MGKRTKKEGKRRRGVAVLPGLAALAVAIIAWFWVQNQPVKDFDHRYFPSTRDINGQFIPIACDAVAGRPRFEGCSPERCGRFIHDNFISSKESDMLKAIVERALSYGGSSSGTNVFDLASGALSYGTKFLDVYQAVKSAHLKDPSARQSLFTTEEADLLDSIYGRIKSKLKDAFGITGDLYLTRPSFFSKIQGAGKSRTVNDEYWHEHVDTEQYGTFDFTGLVYLSTFGNEFRGGQFDFLDADPRTGNKTLRTVVEPRTGRLSLFTSGSENLHRVQKVTSGTRIAFTVAFTCDPKHAVEEITDKGRNGV